MFGKKCVARRCCKNFEVRLPFQRIQIVFRLSTSFSGGIIWLDLYVWEAVQDGTWLQLSPVQYLPEIGSITSVSGSCCLSRI